MAVNDTTQIDSSTIEAFAQEELIQEDTIIQPIDVLEEDTQWEPSLPQQETEETELFSPIPEQEQFPDEFVISGMDTSSIHETDSNSIESESYNFISEPEVPIVAVSQKPVQIPPTDSMVSPVEISIPSSLLDTNSLTNPSGFIAFIQEKEALPLLPIYKDSLGMSMSESIKTRSIKDEYPGFEAKPLPQVLQNQTWFTPLLFILFFCYGLVLIRKKKTLTEEIKRFFTSSEKSDINYRGDSFTDSSQTRSFLIILGVINISLFSFFTISELFDYKTENYVLVITFSIVLIFIYLLFKIATIKLIGYVFFDNYLSAKWIRSFNSFVLFLGIVLIPVILLLAFGSASCFNPVIYAGLFLSFCLFILYLFQVVTFFFQGFYSLFYLILYLCSLEILPLIALLWGLITVSKNYNLILM
jgi:hypothetical protein